MSYNSKQGHCSYLCTGSSSSMVVIEGNRIFNTPDTTHERQTPEEAECLDDIEVSTYTMRNRKKTSIVWQELAIFKLADGIEKEVCSFFALFNEVTNIISAPRQIHIVRDSLYELYKEYVDEYATANVGT
ncbi:hypothetical protein Gohar_018652 [Gossypium harknessii]|uniref:hAT-like transposase RNase-H fold domain-containing protein n=1 Tax=Gossypium harknessii TaxID=34285 RepID=A0A7J9G9P8_9ROSI|nr:hypothetical protein [Gossypium harknessii]